MKSAYTNTGISWREEYRHADCLMQYTFNIATMLSIKNSSMLMISVSENILVELEFFFYKIKYVPS